MGRIRPTPVYDADGALVKAAIMQISWSGDHRVIDGGATAGFKTAPTLSDGSAPNALLWPL